MNRIVLISLVLFFSSLCLPAADDIHKENAGPNDRSRPMTGFDNDKPDSFSLEKKNRPDHEASTGQIMSLFSVHYLFDHMHNKLVHFPIALALAGFMLTLLQYRWKNLETSTMIIVGMAALGGTLAYFTGSFQEEAFTDYSKDWILEFHEQLGTITTLALWVWLIFLIAKPLKKYSILLAVLVFITVFVTGYVGGILAH